MADEKKGPYVFIPPSRYARIRELRREGRWSLQRGTCPVNNFNRKFNKLLRRAGIKEGQFHDLRRTRLTQWLTNGLSEYEVMTLAGHSEFETTRRFYLAVKEDLLDKARAVTAATMNRNFGARLARAPYLAKT